MNIVGGFRLFFCLFHRTEIQNSSRAEFGEKTTIDKKKRTHRIEANAKCRICKRFYDSLLNLQNMGTVHLMLCYFNMSYRDQISSKVSPTGLDFLDLIIIRLSAYPGIIEQNLEVTLT